MKKLLATALLGLAALGLSTPQASAYYGPFSFLHCGGCFKARYSACAAQYNAFSPFCLTTVQGKGLFCHKCYYVADCPQPYCPPAYPPMCYPADAGGMPGAAAPAVGGAPAGGATGFQAPAPTPSLPGVHAAPMGYPQAMPHVAGYQPYAGYGYPPHSGMMPGQPMMMQGGMVPAGQAPWYWNGQAPMGAR